MKSLLIQPQTTALLGRSYCVIFPTHTQTIISSVVSIKKNVMGLQRVWSKIILILYEKMHIESACGKSVANKTYGIKQLFFPSLVSGQWKGSDRDIIDENKVSAKLYLSYCKSTASLLSCDTLMLYGLHIYFLEGWGEKNILITLQLFPHETIVDNHNIVKFKRWYLGKKKKKKINLRVLNIDHHRGELARVSASI